MDKEATYNVALRAPLDSDQMELLITKRYPEALFYWTKDMEWRLVKYTGERITDLPTLPGQMLHTLRVTEKKPLGVIVLSWAVGVVTVAIPDYEFNLDCKPDPKMSTLFEIQKFLDPFYCRWDMS
jgi:hypothetical protein